MKILIFNSVFFPTQIGGAEKSVLNLAVGLKKLGHEVFVVSIAEKAIGIEKKIIASGVTCYYIENINTYWPFHSSKAIPLHHKITQKISDIYNLKYLKPLRKIFQEVKPDIVHTNNLKGISVAVWKVAKEQNCRIVHTLRDYYLQCSKCTMRNRDINCSKTCTPCKIYSYPKKIISHHVNCIVGVSNHILNTHIQDGFFKNAHCKVIYNSAFVEHSNMTPRTSIGSPIRLGYIGRIEDDKGLNLLLTRLQETHTQFNFKLIVAGDGEQLIINRMNTIDFVNYKGFMNAPDFFNCIDYLIVPSLWNEPMGRVVPEAYSYGVPVLVNRTGGLPELVKDNTTGYYTDINCSESFRIALGKLYSADYEQLSKNCIQESLAYSNEIMTNKYLSVFEDTING